MGSILESKSAQKGNRKWEYFWNPLPPHNRTPNVAKKENTEMGQRSQAAAFILGKKGRDKAPRGLIRPLRAL